MVVPVFLVLLFSCIISFREEPSLEKGKKYVSNLIFYLLLALLVLICTFRPKEMPDYNSYVYYFSNLETGRFEIAFTLISKFINLFSKNSLFLFFTYALISVSLKLYAIRKMSPCFWLSILVYLPYFFILQDMIQIRAAVSTGFLLWAIKFSYDRKITAFLIVTILAFCFHTSALVIILIWFMNPKKIAQKTYLLLIPISYLVVLLGYRFAFLAQYIQIESVQYLWHAYSDRFETEINIFGFLHLARCSICMFLLFHIKKIATRYPLVIILIKVYTLSLLLFILFSDIPVIAFRISQLFMIVEILLIPSIVFVIRNHFLSRSLISIIAFSFFYISVCYTHYLV